MLHHVHTCIAIFFHISYNSWVSTHSINQNNYSVSSKSMPKKIFLTISDFTKCCCIVMLVVGLIDIEHMQSVIKVFFFFFFFFSFKNCYYFGDLETQWPQNPEFFFFFLRFCLSSTVIRGGKSQYWRKKVSSSVSELTNYCFLLERKHLTCDFSNH